MGIWSLGILDGIFPESFRQLELLIFWGYFLEEFFYY